MSALQKAVKCLLLVAVAAGAQESWEAGLSDSDPRKRIRATRELAAAENGFRHVALLAPLLQDDSEEVRAAAIVALIRVRSIDAQPLLIGATEDPSPRVQSLAVDGLVDFYMPGYVKLGRVASITSFGSSLRDRFSKPNPVVLAAYVEVNPEVIGAIGEVLRNGRTDECRANAARAIGILQGRGALDALRSGIRSRNSTIILESVLAAKKLRDQSIGPDIVFLLRDLDPKVREAVIVTVGQLRTPEAVPDLVEIIRTSDREQTRVQALVSLAKIPNNGQRDLFLTFLSHSNKSLRAAAAEGVGRLGTDGDERLIDAQLVNEKATSVKLSLAFAAVTLGNLVRLDLLVEGLKSRFHRLEARPFLVEVSRNPEVLKRLYVPLATGSESQRRHLAYVLSQSGDEESLSHLRNLTEDRNDEVAAAAIEAQRVLQARLSPGA